MIANAKCKNTGNSISSYCREHQDKGDAIAEGQMEFILQFNFSPNEYFTNEALTKT